MSKWETGHKSYEGFGRAMELGNDPEGIQPSYVDNDFESQADRINQVLDQIGDLDIPEEEPEKEAITSSSTNLRDPFYKDYMELLVQTKMSQPERYEEYLKRVLEKLADCPVTEESIRSYVDTQIQKEDLKNNLGKIFG